MRFRRFALAFFLLLIPGILAVPAAADMEVVRTEAGSIALGGVVQAGLTTFLGDEIPVVGRQQLASLDLSSIPTGNRSATWRFATSRGKDREFTLDALRLRASGTILRGRVRFFAQASFVDQVTLLDLRLDLRFIPYTWFHIGRFAPALTFFGAREPEDLYLIDWPLMDVDPFGHAIHSFPFRDTGVEVDVGVPYFRARMGLFNGQDAPLTGDNNTAKDLLVTLTLSPPVEGFGLQGGYRYGLALNEVASLVVDGRFKERNDASQTFVGSLWYTPRLGPILVGEVAYGVYNPTTQTLKTRRKLSWYALAGFDFWRLTGLPVQLLGRYDTMDPDFNVSRDENRVLTAGINYSFEGTHARVALNYLRRMEAFRVVGPDGRLRRGFRHDELKLQVQAAF